MSGDEAQNGSKRITLSILLTVTKVYLPGCDDSARYTSIASQAIPLRNP